jgi:hypothetical protein
MENPTAHSSAVRVEQRRSKRFLVTVAAEVKWHGPGGVRIKEKTQAEEVNAHGGLLRMNTFPNAGDIIELTNLCSTESVEGRMLAVRGSTAEASQGIAIELVVPSETFWGMNFRLMKTTAGLLKLGQDLRPDGIDLRHLREFRVATDCIRRNAWAIEESRQSHSQPQGSQDMLSLLTSERIRCVARLCNELVVQLESHEVTFKTEGVADFYRAIDRTYQFLENSLMPQEMVTRDRRRSTRIELSKGVWVAWQGGGQRFVSRVFELSMGGVFIPTADQPPVGTVVKLIFEVPGGDVHAPAVVRHIVVGLGMGVEFAAMNDDDLARIHQLLNELVR